MSSACSTHNPAELKWLHVKYKTLDYELAILEQYCKILVNTFLNFWLGFSDIAVISSAACCAPLERTLPRSQSSLGRNWSTAQRALTSRCTVTCSRRGRVGGASCWGSPGGMRRLVSDWSHSVALEKDQVSLQRGWPPCCCTRCVKTVCEARWQIWTISSRRRTRRRRGRRSSPRQTLMCSQRTLSKWLSKRKRQWKRRSLRWIMTRPTPLSINRYAFLGADILWFGDPTLTNHAWNANQVLLTNNLVSID